MEVAPGAPDEPGGQVRFMGRIFSVDSTSEPSERFAASWSAAYLQMRLDFWHCEQGSSRSHRSLRFRHSVQDLTGLGRLTLRDCCDCG